MSVRVAILSICALLGVGLAACGSEIGDSCLTNSDCSPSGERICDLSQRDGYCTVLGCDFDTCPEESVCVRFYVGQFTNKNCVPETEDLLNSDATDDCNLDEVCTLAGQCVPRSAELRYCMRKCGGDGDCRDSFYECRDRELMEAHGGEPVRPPGEPLGDDLQRFCASAPF